LVDNWGKVVWLCGVLAGEDPRSRDLDTKQFFVDVPASLDRGSRYTRPRRQVERFVDTWMKWFGCAVSSRAKTPDPEILTLNNFLLMLQHLWIAGLVTLAREDKWGYEDEHELKNLSRLYSGKPTQWHIIYWHNE
jgi:hypothetical protein